MPPEQEMAAHSGYISTAPFLDTSSFTFCWTLRSGGEDVLTVPQFLSLIVPTLFSSPMIGWDDMTGTVTVNCGTLIS